jgi:hypothetical protein
MTGDEIRALRETLGVSRAWLALLLGVAQSSVYRWEDAGAERARAEGLTRDLLYVLAHAVQTLDPAGLAATLTDATRRGGTLGGVGALLSTGSEPRSRENPRANE